MHNESEIEAKKVREIHISSVSQRVWDNERTNEKEGMLEREIEG